MANSSPGEDLKKKSISSVRALAAPLTLTYVTKFAQTPILAFFLTPSDFGIWGLATVLITAMESLTEVGIQKLIVQRDELENAFLRSAWGFMIIRGILLTLLALVLIPYYTAFVDTPEAQFIFTLAVIVPALQGLISPALYLAEREIEFKNIAIYDALSQLLFFCIVILLAYLYRSVLAMVMALLVVEGTKVILSYYFFGIPVRPRLPQWAYLKEIIHHGKHFFLISLGTFITIQMDNLAVGKLLGSEILGYYLIAYTLTNVFVTVVRQLFGRILFPLYTKLVQGDEQAHSKINRILDDQFMLLCLLFAAMFTLAPFAVHLLFSKQWVEAIPIIQILTLAALIRCLGNLIVPMFLAEKKQNILAAGRIIEVITFLPFIYLFTKQYGAIGTAYSISVIFTIALIYRIVMAYRLFKLNVFKSLTMTYLGTFAGIISFAFFSLMYYDRYYSIFEYVVMPIFILFVLVHFYRQGKSFSYFINKYVRHA